MSKEAMKLALDALECLKRDFDADQFEWGIADEAITALREALAEQPAQQDSTCSNTLRAQGKAYPRTCKKCGLGPCVELAQQALDKMAENALEQPAQKCSYPYCGCNSKAWCKVERNEALNKMAENARELGLDYEPNIPFGDNNPGLPWDEVPQAFNDWWNADYDPTGNPFEKDTHAYWAWAGWKAAEQPAQRKPFAWANADDLSADTAFRWCEIGDHKTPVYTSPPAQRKPLTDEEIICTLRPNVWAHVEGASREWMLADARAIESAHGIKKETT